MAAMVTMAAAGKAVYCTLLLSDNYLPGAMVLAHSLRDNGTKAKLAVLITPESLRSDTIDELKRIYDEVIPVRTVLNRTPENLWLMDRPDLVAAFTKIELWRQTQFQRIVYIDCDVVALRAPDELFSLDADLAAVPDVGWPDCFNSGVMSLRPNLQDYYALKALAERGISFDGADQGLLNMHFRNWHRLSFTYNCTPSANYQYIPAYKYFQSTISMIHFIGSKKPWNLPRHVFQAESPHYNQLLGRWWSIYDRHYRTAVGASIQQARLTAVFDGIADEKISTGTPQKGAPFSSSVLEEQSHPDDIAYSNPPAMEAAAQYRAYYPANESRSSSASSWVALHSQLDQPGLTPSTSGVLVASAVPQYVCGEENVSSYLQSASSASGLQMADHRPYSASLPQPQTDHWAGSASSQPFTEPSKPELRHPQQSSSPTHFEPPTAEWDASREPPPLHSRPEGISLKMQTYTMSEDPQLFQPPASYPDAPKNMYYQVPDSRPEPRKLAQIFPWEKSAPKPTRVFPTEDSKSFYSPILSELSPTSSSPLEGQPLGSLVAAVAASWAPDEAAADSWQSYSRMNAWDEVPEIQQYIRSIQRHKKGKTEVIFAANSGSALGSGVDGISQAALQDQLEQTRSVRLTDFPSELERPSLPVTPAPIRRQSVWNQKEAQEDDDDDVDDDGDGKLYQKQQKALDKLLPAAQGVPSQEDWNPLARLEELRRRLQSEVLERADSPDE